MARIRRQLRSLARRPGFALTVILTLGLGIGATTAVFSLVDGVLLTPLPYESPDRLVMVWERNTVREIEQNVTSPANFLAWQEDAGSFDRLAAILQFGTTMVDAGEAERVGTVSVSWPFFDMLGVRPVLGRGFTESDGDPDAGAVPVVLSHGFWQRRFGGDPSAIGRTVGLNGEAAEIVGVLPPGFDFDHLEFRFGWHGPQEIWIPQRFPPGAETARGRYLQVVGKLAAGVSPDEANAEMNTLAARYAREFPDAQTGWDFDVVPLHAQVVQDVDRALLLVLAAVFMVLLIATVNVTNLQLARAFGRRREAAMRLAMGADRRRVVGEHLTESLTLALAGGALGIGLAVSGVAAVKALAPDVPRLGQVSIDWTVLGFALAVSALVGILAGVWPAVRAAAVPVTAALKEGGARAGTGRATQRSRSALVVVQLALSLVLLVGAGLLIRSFGALLDEGVGFPTENLLAAELSFGGTGYETPEERTAFVERLLERANALPGIERASGTVFAPLSGTGSATSFWPNDRPPPEAGQAPVADIRPVHRDYHGVMGIPIRQGRGFTTTDGPDAPLRVVVNQATVDALWPDADPIGQSISMPWGDTLVAEVIGVAGDVRINGPAVSPRPLLYWHRAQWTPFGGLTVVARTTWSPESVAPALRSLVRELDPALPLFNVRSIASDLGDAVSRTRFAMAVLVAFAALALLLAAIGIYGVISYSVGQRAHEFGVRMTFGATRRDVLRRVLGQGAVLAGIALVVGGATALAGIRLLQGLIFGVSPTDIVTLAVTATVLAAVALVAAWIPARRAASTDPMRALRTE